jgi:hypothetical protein
LSVDASHARVQVSEGTVLAELGDQRLQLTAPQAAITIAGRLVSVNVRTVLIDLGKSSQTTGVVNGQHWNNFAPNDAQPGTVEPDDAAPDLANLKFTDSTDSGIDFDFTAYDSQNQGIGAADWAADFTGLFGYPISATRDNFFIYGRSTTFIFSNLRTDGTLYDLTVFGAIDPAVRVRPDAVVRAGAIESSYNANAPGQALLTGLRPDPSGRIVFTVGALDGTGCHVNVITLTEVSATPDADPTDRSRSVKPSPTVKEIR